MLYVSHYVQEVPIYVQKTQKILFTNKILNLIIIIHLKKKNNNNNNCSVEIILIENDSHEISFKKQISSSTGVSQYFYNKSKVSYEEYVKKLENLNIPVHAKSFILAQGAVDSLLAKKNRLCEIIDELSGSSKYKE